MPKWTTPAQKARKEIRPIRRGGIYPWRTEARTSNTKPGERKEPEEDGDDVVDVPAGEGELFAQNEQTESNVPERGPEGNPTRSASERAPATTDVQTHARDPRRKLDPPYPKGRDSERFVGEKEAQLSPPDG